MSNFKMWLKFWNNKMVLFIKYFKHLDLFSYQRSLFYDGNSLGLSFDKIFLFTFGHAAFG